MTLILCFFFRPIDPLVGKQKPWEIHFKGLRPSILRPIVRMKKGLPKASNQSEHKKGRYCSPDPTTNFKFWFLQNFISILLTIQIIFGRKNPQRTNKEKKYSLWMAKKIFNEIRNSINIVWNSLSDLVVKKWQYLHIFSNWQFLHFSHLLN